MRISRKVWIAIPLIAVLGLLYAVVLTVAAGQITRLLPGAVAEAIGGRDADRYDVSVGDVDLSLLLNGLTVRDLTVSIDSTAVSSTVEPALVRTARAWVPASDGIAHRPAPQRQGNLRVLDRSRGADRVALLPGAGRKVGDLSGRRRSVGNGRRVDRVPSAAHLSSTGPDPGRLDRPDPGHEPRRADLPASGPGSDAHGDRDRLGHFREPGAGAGELTGDDRLRHSVPRPRRQPVLRRRDGGERRQPRLGRGDPIRRHSLRPSRPRPSSDDSRSGQTG